MDKALQLIEGTNIAAFWAHLIDGYNYFEVNGMVETENTLYQSAKVTQAFTGIGTKAQNTAKKRLAQLGFLKYKVASKPGEATKSTFYILYPEEYENWSQQHDYDKIRNEKYKELQNPEDKARLDQWIMDNAPLFNNQSITDLGQMQIDQGTFANHTKGHLQTSPTHICKTPKDTVIETKVIETIEIETTQTKGQGCVYANNNYKYLHGKSKAEILELIIDTYTDKIRKNISDINLFREERFIGSVNNIEKEFNKFEIDKGISFYIGILGYLFELEMKTISNPKAFDASHKLENLFKFNQDIVFSVANKKLGEQRYESIHRPASKFENNLHQSL